MPTTECIAQIELGFHAQKRQIDVRADAPDVSSDAGVLALRRIDEHLGITDRLAAVLDDARRSSGRRHSRREQLRQRVYQIALGYEDCNDADTLRHDALWQVVCSDEDPHALSSQPTLSRFENGIGGRELRIMCREMEAEYLERLPRDADFVVLDIDGTDDPTHGGQQLSFFHGFYDQHMYHPLLVYDGEMGDLVSALLRPGRAHASWGADGTLRRLVRAIRQRCPGLPIVIRGDSAFAMPWLLESLDALHHELGDVYYAVGVARNERLLAVAKDAMRRAADAHEATGTHVRDFVSVEYAAESWSRARRVVIKAEHGERGDNPRLVATNIEWVSPRSIYDGIFCGRGQSENYIKDFKNALHADRLSCTRFLANAVRLLLHWAAYRLMHAVRAAAGAIEPRLARVQMDTLRLRLLKVAAIVQVSVRRVLIRLPRGFPGRDTLLRLLGLNTA